MHRRRRLTRRDALWAVACVALATLIGGAAYAAAAPGSYNCSRTDRDGGFVLDCTTAGSPSPSASATQTPSPSPSPTVQLSPSVSPTTATPPVTTPPATTPPPSPTGGNGCLNRLAACGFPNAGNTGVPAGTALTVVQGDLNVTVAGTVVTGKDVRGCIVVSAANVSIKNSRVNCPFNSAIRGFTTDINRPPPSLALVQDTEVICGPNGFTGISAALVVRRVNIHGCENGLDGVNGMLVEDSYIWDMNGCCGNHSDGMQIDQIGGVTVRHNTVIGGPLPAGNAAITLWDEGGAQTHDLLITNNLLAGGGYTLRCGRSGTAVNVVITGNRFGPAGFNYAWGCDVGGEVWTGNVDDATGAVLVAL